MLYYRIAWKSNQSSAWQWKSTKLTSLDVVFRFIRAHSMLAQERLCIFSASSVEGLNEQLAQKNLGLDTDSLSVEEFLRLQGIEAIGNIAVEQQKNGSIVVATSLSVHEGDVEGHMFSDQSISMMHDKRLVYEQGTGGDHDVRYIFTLPCSMPQILTWTRLLGKVQRGELEL